MPRRENSLRLHVAPCWRLRPCFEASRLAAPLTFEAFHLPLHSSEGCVFQTLLHCLFFRVHNFTATGAFGDRLILSPACALWVFWSSLRLLGRGILDLFGRRFKRGFRQSMTLRITVENCDLAGGARCFGSGLFLRAAGGTPCPCPTCCCFFFGLSRRDGNRRSRRAARRPTRPLFRRFRGCWRLLSKLQ